MPLPTPAENPNGLHGRYIIQHADGRPTAPNAIYFVLRLDDGGSDPAHIAACRNAARAYARTAHESPHLRGLAMDLENLCDEFLPEEPPADSE